MAIINTGFSGLYSLTHPDWTTVLSWVHSLPVYSLTWPHFSMSFLGTFIKRYIPDSSDIGHSLPSHHMLQKGFHLIHFLTFMRTDVQVTYMCVPQRGSPEFLKCTRKRKLQNTVIFTVFPFLSPLTFYWIQSEGNTENSHTLLGLYLCGPISRCFWFGAS